MSALGNAIIISNDHRGRVHEGTINSTPKPGTCVQINSQEPVGSRYDWTAFNAAADGDQRLVAVLLEDDLQGKIATDAYVDGSRCRVYCPLPGEELNMLVSNIAGTSDSFAIGDILMINDGDGLLIATTGTPESECFIVMATTAAITADTLVHCMFTGY